MKFDNNIDFGKIAILSQKLEFLSQSKIRKNKSPGLAFHSYELTTATAFKFQLSVVENSEIISQICRF